MAPNRTLLCLIAEFPTVNGTTAVYILHIASQKTKIGLRLDWYLDGELQAFTIRTFERFTPLWNTQKYLSFNINKLAQVCDTSQ